jgi:ribosomal protein L18
MLKRTTNQHGANNPLAQRHTHTHTPINNKQTAAEAVGKKVAELCSAKGISQVAFDRGGFTYHGRVRALADAAREGGLTF